MLIMWSSPPATHWKLPKPPAWLAIVVLVPGAVNQGRAA